MGTFSFGEYQLLSENILEIITDEGVEVDEPQALECIELYQELNRPLGLLINRKNTYSSTFEFVSTIAQCEHIKAFAIYVIGDRSAMVAESQKMFFDVPLHTFFDKNEAINWLQLQVETNKD